MNKEILLLVLISVLTAFLVFFAVVFFPRNRLSGVEVRGGVLYVEELLLSKSSYLYVLRKEYNHGGVKSDLEIGISRLFEPGVYRGVSLGEIYLPKIEEFGTLYVYIYEENGDMLFDAKKDKLVGDGVKLIK